LRKSQEEDGRKKKEKIPKQNGGLRRLLNCNPIRAVAQTVSSIPASGAARGDRTVALRYE
jgi:hypothetical protein